jgi:hypothetical protein
VHARMRASGAKKVDVSITPDLVHRKSGRDDLLRWAVAAGECVDSIVCSVFFFASLVGHVD